MRTLVFILLAIVALALQACRKPAPIDDSKVTVMASVPETTDAGTLEKRYPTLTDPVDRYDVVHTLADSPPAEAIAAFGRLLALEKDPELRAEMIDTLSTFDEEIPARLAILAPLLETASEPEEVREAALAALEQIDDRRAISVWEKLRTNTHPEIREMAEARIEELRE